VHVLQFVDGKLYLVCWKYLMQLVMCRRKYSGL